MLVGADYYTLFVASLILSLLCLKLKPSNLIGRNLKLPLQEVTSKMLTMTCQT